MTPHQYLQNFNGRRFETRPAVERNKGWLGPKWLGKRALARQGQLTLDNRGVLFARFLASALPESSFSVDGFQARNQRQSGSVSEKSLSCMKDRSFPFSPWSLENHSHESYFPQGGQISTKSFDCANVAELGTWTQDLNFVKDLQFTSHPEL
jgi:hypothetical protein